MFKYQILHYCACGCGCIMPILKNKRKGDYRFNKFIIGHKLKLSLPKRRRADVLKKKRRYQEDAHFRMKKLEAQARWRKRHPLYAKKYIYEHRDRYSALFTLWKWGMTANQELIPLLIKLKHIKEVSNEKIRN